MKRSGQVFFSYNFADKVVAKDLERRLGEYSLDVWLDERRLRPGVDLDETLVAAIDASSAAVVIIGPHGVSKGVQTTEWHLLYARLLQKEMRVVPVLLPNAPDIKKLPPAMRRLAWADLRDGVDKDGLDRIVWGVTGDARHLARVHALREAGIAALSKGHTTVDDLKHFLERALPHPPDVREKEGMWRWRGKYMGVPILVLADDNAKRMRVLAQVASAEAISPEFLEAMLEANFDRALDAKYVLSNDKVLACFAHPLDSLREDLFRDALAQILALCQNYGSTFHGGLWAFGDGNLKPMVK